MTLDNERFWIVRASLILVGVLFGFFIIAPGVLQYPLDYDQAIRLLQIIVPVFVGYLGLATAYLFQGGAAKMTTVVVSNRQLLRLLLRGPVYVVGGGLLVVVLVFWHSNRVAGAPASGMTIDQLSWFISALLGLLSATTGLIVAKIFPSEQK